MKKALTLLISLIGISSFASTIVWGINTKGYFGTSSLGSKATGYLVYLGDIGDETAPSWENSDYLAIANGTSENYTSKKTSSASKVSGEAELTAGAAVYSGATKTVTDGKSVFGVMLVYTDGTGEDAKTYYNLGSTTYTFDTSDTDHYEAVPSDTFTWQSSGPTSNSDTSGQGWTAVPEPSVAIMGLLGLGMLLKRRRA